MCNEVEDIISQLPQLNTLLQNVFYLAISVSPLVLLLPKKINGEHIRKDYLIAVGLLLL